ncbi:MlaD family protein [Mangrovivirga sp. M17]|uniref:MlaD family protein n=1 Tax=Mangrovivirga halotolerans TaxID=2993936 RepID=A0ABT3RQR6_9BACT|nr:MlaD family protein [Mangrovivirga halotolerans]MCX2744128.1 MlaD family protein [Mangrovivirga halotolerans]
MNLRLIKIFFLSVLIFACTKSTKTIYLKTEKVNGLTTKSKVLVKDFQIGMVDDIAINNQGEIIVKLNLDEVPKLATDSKFKVESTDLFGTKVIAVTLGKGNEFINSGDTINLIKKEENTYQLDSLLDKSKNYIKELLED